jgi:AraC family transcriptional regulator of adaptative response / DNA-3-methyladenine glycosylase II
VLLAQLRRDAIPGVEVVDGARYARTVRLDGRTGVVLAEDAASSRDAARAANGARARSAFLRIDVSPSLVPALMPLLARLRQLLDLDAQPAAVDAHLEQGGLGALVRRRPGVRVPGAIDGFEVALATLLRGAARSAAAPALVGRVARALGEPLDTGVPGLTHLAPTPARVAAAGADALAALGVPPRRAAAIAAVARMTAAGALRLEPGGDVAGTRRALAAIEGVGDRLATDIVGRAHSWPDAFPEGDRALQRAAGVASAEELLARAEAWRPWRAYAAVHLRLRGAPS